MSLYTYSGKTDSDGSDDKDKYSKRSGKGNKGAYIAKNQQEFGLKKRIKP